MRQIVCAYGKAWFSISAMNFKFRAILCSLRFEKNCARKPSSYINRVVLFFASSDKKAKGKLSRAAKKRGSSRAVIGKPLKSFPNVMSSGTQWSRDISTARRRTHAFHAFLYEKLHLHAVAPLPEKSCVAIFFGSPYKVRFLGSARNDILKRYAVTK